MQVSYLENDTYQLNLTIENCTSENLCDNQTLILTNLTKEKLYDLIDNSSSLFFGQTNQTCTLNILNLGCDDKNCIICPDTKNNCTLCKLGFGLTE